MLHKIFLKRNNFLIIVLLIGIFLRFYNISWSSYYYFHPDERNISSVIAASFSTPLSEVIFKSTFSYGNFLIIFTYILEHIISFFSHNSDTSALAVILLRIESAIFSVLTSLVILGMGLLYSKKAGWIAFILSIFSIGFIQQSHFGVSDMFITFCIASSCYFLLKKIYKKKIRYFFISLFYISLASSVKINALIFFLIPCFVYLKTSYKKKYIILVLFFIILPFIFSPYYLTKDFYGLLHYEQGVVTGSLPVFYTQSFFNAIPIYFQLLNIYPFLLNPFITILFVSAFIVVTFFAVGKKDIIKTTILIYFLFSFLPSSFLYAKWTRYMIPTLPFIYLIISIFFSDGFIKYKKSYWKILVYGSIGISFIYAICYCITAFGQLDTRILAADWAKKNISSQSTILSEASDPGSVVFQQNFPSITFFDFYNLDIDSALQQDFSIKAQTSKYVILPSQRLVRSRLLDAKHFPRSSKFYKSLFDKKNYQLLYKTPCDIFCFIAYSGDPVFHYEETAYVFERPTIFIFKKK